MGLEYRLGLAQYYEQPLPFDIEAVTSSQLKYIGQRVSVDVLQQEFGHNIQPQALSEEIEDFDKERVDDLSADALYELINALNLNKESFNKVTEGSEPVDSYTVLFANDEAIQLVTFSSLYVWEILSDIPDMAEKTGTSIKKIHHYMNINPHVHPDGSGPLSVRNCSAEDYGDCVIFEDIENRLGSIATKLTNKGPRVRAILKSLGRCWQDHTGVENRFVIYDGVLVLMTLASVTGVPALANPMFLPRRLHEFVNSVERIPEKCASE